MTEESESAVYIKMESQDGQEETMSGLTSTTTEMSEIDRNKERLVKLERIRRKLRDRDSRLSMLVKENNASLLAGTAHPYEGSTNSAGSEEDSKEALRVLSYAAFKLQRQVDKKEDEIKALQQTIEELKGSLNEKEKEKSTLKIDMNLFRKSLGAHTEHVDRLSHDVDAKNKAISALRMENDQHKQQIKEFKDKLDASHKDYEWMRKESMSKSEQIEYFEFELLSKNDEIDNLHRELDRKLKRIVELEVDIELMEAHMSRLSGNRGESFHLPSAATTSSPVRTASVGSIEELFDPVVNQPAKRSPLSRLRELKCQKVEDTEAAAAAAAAAIMRTCSGETSVNGSFPTDVSSTDTTVVISSSTPSTDVSTPPRNRWRSGLRSTKHAKGSPDYYMEVIDKLRSDLLAMETKYKEHKYDTSKLIERLKQENNEYLIKLVCMDCRMRQADEQTPLIALLPEGGTVETSETLLFEGSVESGESPLASVLRKKSLRSADSKLPSSVEYFKQRADALEGERLVLRREIEDLKTKVSETKQSARTREMADQRTIDDLVFQMEAQTVKIAELERSRLSGTLNEGQGMSLEYTSRLESKIQEQATEIDNLQLQSDLKDQAIQALRAQLVDKRMRQISI